MLCSINSLVDEKKRLEHFNGSEPKAQAKLKPDEWHPLRKALQSDGVMEYFQIPWKTPGIESELSKISMSKEVAPNIMTLNLALFILHILAAANHELTWKYGPLELESLENRICREITLPITPESAQRLESGKNGSHAATSTPGNKRVKEIIVINPEEEVEDEIVASASSSFAGPQGPQFFNKVGFDLFYV